MHITSDTRTESLDELAILASKLFSPILNRGADPLPMVTSSPVGPDEKGVRSTVHALPSPINPSLDPCRSPDNNDLPRARGLVPGRVAATFLAP
jgi:hypothetical protein